MEIIAKSIKKSYEINMINTKKNIGFIYTAVLLLYINTVNRKIN